MTTDGPPVPQRPSPVRVTAELDPALSRWLWLVKWLLAIPHFIVLWFLWIAFFFSSIGAFFAILVTGHFPRPLFDFNVGVLRWTWRVTYYAYGVLGTDRYPPFTLADRVDYPARLEIDRPERLSRGLVLVKSWLLAIPHYLVISFFVGGGFIAASQAADKQELGLFGGGLIGLLAVIAAIALLFTGRYPRDIFALLIGLHRWVLRVGAYAALMTDEYPPFRLDQGGDADRDGTGEAALLLEDRQDTTPGPGRTATIIIGIVCLVVAIGLLLAATSLWAAKQALPDDDGFFTAPVVSCRVDSYAIVSEPIRLDLSGPEGLTPESVLGDGKVTATSRDGSPVFVGIADSRLVENYLSGTARTTIRPDSDADDGALAGCDSTTGQAPPALPTSLAIWTTSATGTGSQSITWPIKDGDWTVVIMNLDASPGLDVEVDVGATFPVINPVITAIAITGALFLLVAVGLLVGPAVVRSVRQRRTSHPPG